MAKKFKDLNDQDTLWYIDPLTEKIDGLKIKYISGVPIEEAKKLEAAKHYISIHVYRNDAIVQATDLEAIPTVCYYVDGRKEVQICIVNVQIGGHLVPMPVPYSTNKKVLEDFMGASASTKTRKYNG